MDWTSLACVLQDGPSPCDGWRKAIWRLCLLSAAWWLRKLGLVERVSWTSGDEVDRRRLLKPLAWSPRLLCKSSYFMKNTFLVKGPFKKCGYVIWEVVQRRTFPKRATVCDWEWAEWARPRLWGNGHSRAEVSTHLVTSCPGPWQMPALTVQWIAVVFLWLVRSLEMSRRKSHKFLVYSPRDKSDLALFIMKPHWVP